MILKHTGWSEEPVGKRVGEGVEKGERGWRKGRLGRVLSLWFKGVQEGKQEGRGVGLRKLVI